MLPHFEPNSIDLVLTDPPYNIKKDSWDDIQDYINWLTVRFYHMQEALKFNGSFYWFHSEMPVIAELMQWLKKNSNFIFRQFITWNKRFGGSPNKGYMDGHVAVEDLRNYKKMAEYILYYTFQDETGLSHIMGHVVYPIRDYIREEIIKARGKIVLKEINQLLGTATNGGGVASATLSLDKAVPAMITEEHYKKLQEWLNDGREYKYLRREYKYLRREYEDLRREYEDLRYVFNNQGTHHSVWNYDFAGKEGHVTPKPIDLIGNILAHSSNRESVILDPFLGSGTTTVACKQLGRKCIGIEIESKYLDIAIERLRQEVLF
jgi:site-specific DNA-methyltransferase (adenine-specific)